MGSQYSHNGRMVQQKAISYNALNKPTSVTVTDYDAASGTEHHQRHHDHDL